MTYINSAQSKFTTERLLPKLSISLTLGFAWMLSGCIEAEMPGAPQDGAQQVVERGSEDKDGLAAGDAEGASYATTNQRNGSRLLSRVVVTDEGHESPVGWHDSELQEDCEFQQDARGALRCFPTRAVRDLLYTDAGCSQAVVAPEVGFEARYVYRTEGVQCGVGIQPYMLGEPIVAPSEIFALNEAGECVATPAPAALFRALGAAVELEHFVAARYGIEDNAARIKAVGLVADDGAVAVTEFMDSELDTRCKWSGDDEVSCLPSGQRVSKFADAVLSQPLLGQETAACSEGPGFGTNFGLNECGDDFYRPGAPFEGSTIYELSSSGYEVTAVEPEQAATLRRGDRVRDEEFATGAIERKVASDARLTPMHLTTPDGGIWFSHWYDNVLETACTFMMGSDNEWRCLPSDAGDSVLYADAACTEPVAEVENACGAQSPAPAFVAEDGLAFRRVLAPRTLTTVYEKSSAGCSGRAVQWNQGFFELSAVLHVARFVSGSIVVR